MPEKPRIVNTTLLNSEGNLPLNSSDPRLGREKLCKGNEFIPESSTNFGKEMSNLLKNFDCDVNAILLNKRNGFKKLVQDSVEKTTAKVSESDFNQIMERKKRVEQFEEVFYEVMQHATSELEKIKAVEDKIQNILQLKENKKDAEKTAYIHRLQELKKIHDKFCKGMNALEFDHMKQYSTIIDNVRKDMRVLQKKFLADAQRNEMGNVRKQLKKSFY